MVTKPYQTIGFIGALLGANIIVVLFNISEKITLSAQNQIGEALSYLLLGSIVIDFFWRSETPPFYLIPFFAFFTGLIYQPFSYLVIFNLNLLRQILLEWIIYSIPVILFVGLPVMLISEFFKRKNQAIQLFFISLTISMTTMAIFAMLHTRYILEATKLVGINA